MSGHNLIVGMHSIQNQAVVGSGNELKVNFEGCKHSASRVERPIPSETITWLLEGLNDPNNLEILKNEAKTRMEVGSGETSSTLEFGLGNFSKLLNGQVTYRYLSMNVTLIKSGKDVSNSFDIEVHKLNDNLEPVGVAVPKKSFSLGQHGVAVNIKPDLILLSSKNEGIVYYDSKGPVANEKLYTVPDRLLYGVIVTPIKCNATLSQDAVTSTLNIALSPTSSAANFKKGLLSQHLQKFYSTAEDNYSDLKLESRDGVEINVHRFILAARSTVFHQLIEKESKQNAFSGVIKIGDVDAKPLMILVHWMYTEELREDANKIIEEVVHAATRYELQDLLDILDEELIKICNVDNMLRLFQLGKDTGMETAVKQISVFIKENL